jgi:hypothetical protein
VNGVELLPLPPASLTEIGPVEAEAGTVAVILVSELTVKVAAPPLNATLVAPVNADPSIVTFVPIVPEAGVNEEITG